MGGHESVDTRSDPPPNQKNASSSTLHNSTNITAFGTVISGNRRKNDRLSPYTDLLS
mgnify:CR=1 FL=1